ncbi:MAG TPA: FAD-dependent monooxygenase, partial [Micromonosporaceae bacterium]
DAATLASLLREAAPGAALRSAVRAYDRMRRPRVATVVRQTRRMSAVLRSRSRLALRARNAALGAVTPRLPGSAAEIAAQWRPPA